ncbi:MAG: hypothetical protein JWM68_5703 [Verrucomicrobiales bacterium]|nr:hypothetical protein [Verrucomicrobiales bacterium]
MGSVRGETQGLKARHVIAQAQRTSRAQAWVKLV